MIKVVLFDADGVLVNGKMFSEHLADDYGITTEITRPFFSTVFMDCVTGKADLKEELPPYLKQWGWKKSVDEFIEYWHSSEHTINEPLMAYIKQLKQKGILCCLATNQTTYRFEYMLKGMGFENIFDRCYGSAHLGHRKPDLEFYAKVMNDLERIKRKEVLLWDDTEKNIDAAREFGMKAEYYYNFERFRQTMDQVYFKV